MASRVTALRSRLRKVEGKKKPAKYHNRKVTINGVEFDSKAEGQFFLLALEARRNGLLTMIELQPEYVLQPTFKKNGRTWRGIKYIADFRLTYPDGSQVIVDVKGSKGYLTEMFRIKQKLFEYKYPDLSLVLWSTPDLWVPGCEPEQKKSRAKSTKSV